MKRCTVMAVLLAVMLLVPEVGFASGVPQSKAKMSLLKKDGVTFDYRKAAKQKLYHYDTLQGGCASDGYAYLTLYDRNKEKCKVVKVDLAARKVVKVSKALPIYHGNNLTFNTRKDRIVATCCKVKTKRVVFIDPDTLKITGKKTIKLTKKVKGLPAKVRKKYSGFSAIAYNQEKDCYVGRLRGNDNVILFDGKLRPKKYIKLSGKRTSLLSQGMESAGKYIYDVRSFKGKKKYSMITVHTMNGKLVRRLKVAYGKKPGNELQCLFHDGTQFYVGTYYTTSQRHDDQAHHVRRVNRIYKMKNLTYPKA